MSNGEIILYQTEDGQTFEEKELEPNGTVAKFATVQSEGRREITSISMSSWVRPRRFRRNI